MAINSLKNRILFFFIAASAAIITAFGVFTYTITEKDLNSELEKRLLVTAGLIKNEINTETIPVLKLKGRVHSSLKEKLSGFTSDYGINNIMIISGSKEAVFSLDDRPLHHLYLDYYEMEKAFAGEKTFTMLYKGAQGRHYKSLYVPLDGGSLLAVEASAVFIQNRSKYITSLAIAGLIIFGAAFFLAYWVSGRLSRSIRILKEKAEKMSKGDFTQTAEMQGEAEVEALSESLEAMRLKLKAYIEEKDKMATVGEFAAAIAHETRNSLGVISGYAELIRESAKDEKIKKRSDDIVKNALKMSEFLNNFMTYAREFTPEMQEADICSVIRETAHETGQDYKDRIVLDCRGVINAVIDVYLFRKALYNIVMNAFQAMGSEGMVFIKAYEKEGRKVISIRDEGRGMDKDKLKKIFTPFFTDKKGGVGLGLPITYRIIKEVHGGEISAESKEGKGTEIVIKL